MAARTFEWLRPAESVNLECEDCRYLGTERGPAGLPALLARSRLTDG